MKIRPADIGDLDEIARIEAACFDRERYPPELLFQMLSQEDFATFIAEDGEAIGSVTVHCQGEGAHLVSLAVLPKFRNRGVASALLAEAERAARRLGAARMVLQVGVLNVPAMNLYLHRGYVLEGVIRDYYGPRRDAYFMWRTL